MLAMFCLLIKVPVIQVWFVKIYHVYFSVYFVIDRKTFKTNQNPRPNTQHLWPYLGPSEVIQRQDWALESDAAKLLPSSCSPHFASGYKHTTMSKPRKC